jgi:hypothetical protein
MEDAKPRFVTETAIDFDELHLKPAKHIPLRVYEGQPLVRAPDYNGAIVNEIVRERHYPGGIRP